MLIVKSMKKMLMILLVSVCVASCNNDAENTPTKMDTILPDTSLTPAPDTTNFNLPDTISAN